MDNIYFITGAQGCIGSWVVKTLVERGDLPVVFDCSENAGRLSAIMDRLLIGRVRFLIGDITDSRVVGEALARSNARHVIHLAGLQVPSCKANPITGAMVNVIGTLNVFETARAQGIDRVVYASSAAVFGQSEDDAPLDESAACEPATHYGVFKRTNEGNARVYYLDYGMSSVGLRPLTVYGPGRDTGITSDPTKAMKAAVLGRRFHIRFGGTTDFQYVADTAAAFIACADCAPAGAHVFNLHGDAVEMSELIRVVDSQLPRENQGLISFSGPSIPVASALSDAAIRGTIEGLPHTPLEQGVRQTIENFTSLRDQGALDTSDIDA